ncbi:MAG: M23 family peptidase [Bacteroidaceae bacterium]|nr:M23 family peptidase [Bacteroidaceae bacterium]MBR1939849.1 M23 family peptidase [Bacteroidaceae bacterium]
MKKWVAYISLCCCALTLHAQQYVPPMDHVITFSGNYGEIRADHYHGGLDFKTGGAEGKVVRAIADGYISRIQVNSSSGLVLTVTFPDGWSAAYRHLSSFMEPIASRVKAWQYEHQSWEMELRPAPEEYPVKAGQPIARSGNTGYSLGPHLHLDLFNAEDEYVDPLPFFLDKVKDHTAPKPEGFMLFPQPGQGVVDGSQAQKTFPLNPQKPIQVWGLVGVGIKAYDYMDGVHNKYGVKFVTLTVDGDTIFRSTVDHFAYEENRYINSWCEGQYMKSFIEPGNKLRMLQAYNENNGLLTINEERPYKLQYTLSDAFGNTTKVNLTLQGKRQEIAPLPYGDEETLHYDRVNVVQRPGLQLVIPRGALYKDAHLNYQQRTTDSAAIASVYRITDDVIKLHTGAELQIGVRNMPVEDATKYHIVRVGKDGRKSSVGGKLEEGFVKARVLQLGTFSVDVDTIPPTIKPVNQNTWAKTGKVTLKPEDKETGISRYEAMIDGEWALLGRPNSANNNLVLVLDPEHVTKGKRHELAVTVTDGCGNQTTEHFVFTW